MVSRNISIRKEAYDFLKSLKTRNKSFSEVILEFKEHGAKKDVMRLFGALKEEGIDWKEKERKMGAFRESFHKRLGTKRT